MGNVDKSNPTSCLRLGVLLVVSIVSYPPAITHASEWKPFGLQNKNVSSLASAPGLLCAGTQTTGVFCLDVSTPESSWNPLGLAGTPITGLWIDPRRPNVILAAVGLAVPPSTLLYRTVDGGSNWQPADGGMTDSPWAVHGVPGLSTTYAGGARIWRSEDLGDTWSEVFFDGGIYSLEVAPTDADTVWVGGETIFFEGFTRRSRNGGTDWEVVWDSNQIGDNQTADIAAHPIVDGLVLTGHEGFVLRSFNHGDMFEEVLTAQARFFLQWDSENPDRAYAAGSPNSPGVGFAFVSRDLGQTWSSVTGLLETRSIHRLAVDGNRLGVVYAATDDGVFRFYGGGMLLCLDALAGIDRIQLDSGPCSPPPIADSIIGDVIVGNLAAVRLAEDHVDLGEVECIIEDANVGVAEIDPPEPPPGEVLFLLVRLNGSSDYGLGDAGRPRLPFLGGCSP